MSLSPETLITQLRWRYATKKFDPTKKIPQATWQALEETLVLTPSSYGLQPWKFLVLSNPELRQKLVPVSWHQTQPVDCSHFVVMAIRQNMDAQWVDKNIARTAEVRGIAAESLAGLRKMIVGGLLRPEVNINEWAMRQVYIALGNFMTSAALLGIDTCPMEGLDPRAYDEILGLPAQGYATCVAVAAGYRAGEDKYATLAKVRFAASDVIEHR